MSQEQAPTMEGLGAHSPRAEAPFMPPLFAAAAPITADDAPSLNTDNTTTETILRAAHDASARADLSSRGGTGEEGVHPAALPANAQQLPGSAQPLQQPSQATRTGHLATEQLPSMPTAESEGFPSSLRKRTAEDNLSMYKDQVALELDQVEERVILRNRTSLPISLRGWKLQSSKGGGVTFYFPADAVLQAGGTVEVVSGRQSHRKANGRTKFHWTNRFMWTRHNDRGWLFDGEDCFVGMVANGGKRSRAEVEIKDADLVGQCVVLANTDPSNAVNVSDWQLFSTYTPDFFIMPPGTAINPRQELRIWCGKGVLDRAPGPTDLLWERWNMLNPRGDTLLLFNINGDVVSSLHKDGGPLDSRHKVEILGFDLIEGLVTIVNNWDEESRLAGWKLTNADGSFAFLFPDDYILPSGGFVRVWSGPGSTLKHDGDANLAWVEQPVWNANLDTCRLFNAEGALVSEVTEERAKLEVSVAELDLVSGYLELKNNTSRELSMANWKLVCKSGDMYHFPHTFSLLPLSAARVWAGADASRKANGETDLLWTERDVFDKQGDAVAVYDAHDRLVSRLMVHAAAQPKPAPIDLAEVRTAEVLTG